MIRRFRLWLRVVLPIDQLAYIVLAVLLALTSVRLIRDRGSEDELAIWKIYVVYGSTILYAAFRAIYFHPIENRRYGNWLADSPWKYPQPLPLGPLQLVWQDALLILVLSVFLPAEILSHWSVLILFVFVYCFGLGFNFCRIGVYAPLFLMSFLVGWFILALPHALWCAAIVLAIYGVAYWGMLLLLQQISDGEEVPPHIGWGLPTGQVEPLLSWPVPPSRTERYQWDISQSDAFQFAMVVGWLFFCIAWRARDANDYEEGLAIGLGWIAIVAILGRILIYVVGYVPPVSLLGRIFLWRWIIPGYDYVLLAPLAALLSAIILPNVGKSLGLPIPIVYSVTAAAVTWLTLALPPRRAEWQLTGHHRIAYRLRAAAYEKTAASKMIPRTK